jgi:hypothetical protein
MMSCGGSTVERNVVLMLDEEEKVKRELFFSDYDFPKDYVNMAHPEDYKIVHTAITRKLFYNMEIIIQEPCSRYLSCFQVKIVRQLPLFAILEHPCLYI